MLDIDFLQNPKLGKHLVHLYESGSFRAEVAQIARQAAVQRGWLWQDMDPREPTVAAGSALYGSTMIAVDIDACCAAGHLSRLLPSIAHCLRTAPETHFYVFGRGGPDLMNAEAWDDVLNAATVLHEPELSPTTLVKVLNQVGPGWAIPVQTITNRPALEKSLRDWLRVGGVSLAQFLAQIDPLMVACVDAETLAFDPEIFTQAVAGEGASPPTTWVDPLARFLRTPTAATRMTLMTALDRALTTERRPVRDVIAGVYRATFDLAQANALLNPGAGVVPDGWNGDRWESSRAHASLPLPGLLLWQTFLAHHEPVLLAHGMVGWDALLRQIPAVGKS